MVRKIINYQILLAFNVQKEQYGNNLKYSYVEFILWVLWCMFSPLQFSAPIGIMLCILATASMFVQEQKKKKVQLCVVSDKFRIANLLYISPVGIALFVGILLALLYILWLVLYYTVICEGMAERHTALEKMLEMFQSFRAHGLFGVLLIGGLFYVSWFIKMIFHSKKNKIIHILGNVLVVVFQTGYIVYLRISLYSSKDYDGYSQLKITQLPEIWKESYVHLYFMWGMVLILGCIAWIVCNKATEDMQDVCEELALVDTMDAMQKKQRMEQRKKKYQKQAVLGVVVVITVWLAVFGAIFWIINPTGGEKFSIVVDGTEKNLSEAYDKWDDYRAEIGIDKELWYSHKLSIFPKQVKEEDIQTYLAKVEGEFGENWSSNCGYYRYLECQYSEEDYKKEKDRLCSVKKKCGVLKDTIHFDTLAVIACYNMKFNEFEYALLDDSERQIQYIFCEQSINLEDIETEHNILPHTMMYQVIPKEERNYQGGFSIYEEK